jgi:hypothetical protein
MYYRAELHAWLWKYIFGGDALADLYGTSTIDTSTAAITTSGTGFGRTLHGVNTAAAASYAKEVKLMHYVMLTMSIGTVPYGRASVIADGMYDLDAPSNM